MPVPLAAVPVIAGLVVTTARAQGWMFRKQARLIHRVTKRVAPKRYQERLDSTFGRVDGYYERFNQGSDRLAKTTGLTVPGTLLSGVGVFPGTGKLLPLLRYLPVAEPRASELLRGGIRAASTYDRYAGKIPFVSRLLKNRSWQGTSRVVAPEVTHITPSSVRH